MIDRGAWKRVARLAWPVLGALALASCGRNLGKADSYEALGDSMMMQGAYPAAARNYGRSTGYDSNEPRRWMKLARASRETGDAGAAAAAFQRALDLDPANIEALENLSVLMVRAGRYDDVHTYLDPLLVLVPDDLAGALASGAIALHERHFDEALVIAERLIATTPSSGEGYRLKAHVLQGQGNPGAGARILTDFMARYGENVILAEELMDLYHAAGSREGIRALSLVLARLKPEDPRYGMEAVRALRARGDQAAAAAQLEAVKRRFGGNVEVMRAVADYLAAILPRDRATAEITRLAEGRTAPVVAMVATRLAQSGSAPAAIDLLRPRLGGAVDSGNVDIQATYAEALLAAGRTAEANRQADAVIAFDPGNDVALTTRAKIALARKDWSAALTDAQTVASDRPDDAGAALLVAQVYDASGNDTLAGQAYGDAATRVPDSLAVVAARVAWMQRHGQASGAKAIAAQFAGTHPRMAGAWTLYASSCDAAGDRRCAAAARGRNAGS